MTIGRSFTRAGWRQRGHRTSSTTRSIVELHVARAALVGEDPHAFQPDEGLHDFGRVVKDEGVSIFLDHT